MAFWRHIKNRERDALSIPKRAAFVSLYKNSFSSNPPAVVKGLKTTSPRVRFEIAPEKDRRIRPPVVSSERNRNNINKKIIFAQWQRASDRRRFNPAGQNAWPSNVYGAAALLKKSTPPKFDTAALPCVDRSVRREVMFAKKLAGRGYRKKKRRSWRSDIHC